MYILKVATNVFVKNALSENKKRTIMGVSNRENKQGTSGEMVKTGGGGFN